jgi:acyl dehydratase
VDRECQLCIEDIGVGTELPSLTKEPTYMQLVEYAGASRDFYVIHHDRDYAKSVGLPDVIVQGSLKGAFLGQLVTDWIGEEGTLVRLGVQYRGVDPPGQRLVARGVVTSVSSESGRYFAECDLWIENEAGERTTRGSATVRLPGPRM